MAGGTPWLLFCAWRYGGQEPWRTYNMLDEGFRPVWDAELPAYRPKHPERLQRFLLACAKVAAIIAGQMKDDRARARAAQHARERQR